MKWRIACFASILALGVAAAAAQPSEAYVNQVDRSSRGSVTAPSAGGGIEGSAYIFQVPETARPVPPRVVQRRAPARATAPRQPQTAAIPPARQAVFPSVGSGVALALSQAAAARRFPDVGAGVGAP
ncbi:MAG: hypothetical protein IBJ07_16260 [Rhizobiaceae bacterium]|nr:hypothetical protein [Rhizobiaceae bacterium]